MNFYFFVFFLATCSLGFSNSKCISDSIQRTIENESTQINFIENQNGPKPKLAKAYNARGISNFFNAEYDKALQDFNKVIEVLEEIEAGESLLAGAWMGKMLTHAYLGDEQNVILDLQMLDYIFSCHQPCCSLNSNHCFPVNTHDKMLESKSAWPENKPMSTWECEQTVKNTAFAMECLATKIPQNSIKLLAIKGIDEMKEAALNCCYRGGLWSACLKPMAEKFHQWNQKWKLFGIPPDPAWD